MDFKKVSIKRPSDKVISRMRNGHKVRMMKGEGLDIMMKPKSIVTMAKKFATSAVASWCGSVSLLQTVAVHTTDRTCGPTKSQ
jgi:hypothetical protein